MKSAVILAALAILTACGKSNPTTPSVLSVIITAPKQTISVGEAVQLTTTARDVNGVTINGAKITYQSSASSVLNVNTSGRVIGVAAGTAIVTATSGGQTSQPFPFTVVAGSVAAVVTMQANTFTPALVTIKTNQSVLFDFPADQHNVIFAQRTGKPADIPVTAGAQVSRTFGTAGTFPYDCTLHPGMSGQIIVNP